MSRRSAWFCYGLCPVVSAKKILQKFGLTITSRFLTVGGCGMSGLFPTINILFVITHLSCFFRAQFDIKWHSGLNHMEDPKPRIYLSCNYCRSSISTSVISDASKLNNFNQLSHHQYNRSSSANTSASKYRTVSCSNCAKSLPRCSLCLTQLGTPSGIYWRPRLLFGKNDKKLSPFASWFTWCQTCRHGGHSSHILDWFTENANCPVAGCKCKCMSMDANARLIWIVCFRLLQPFIDDTTLQRTSMHNLLVHPVIYIFESSQHTWELLSTQAVDMQGGYFILFFCNSNKSASHSCYYLA